MAASFAYFFLTPLAMQRVYGFSPLQAAIGFLPETIPLFLVAFYVSRIPSFVKNSHIIMMGVSVMLVGMVLAVLLKIGTGYLIGLALPMLIIGVGQGLALGPLTISGVTNTSSNLSGAASGVVNTVHQIGGSVGLSIVVSMTGKLTDSEVAYNTQLIWIAVLILIAFIFSIGIVIYEKG